jgi:hypothetical protein
MPRGQEADVDVFQRRRRRRARDRIRADLGARQDARRESPASIRRSRDPVASSIQVIESIQPVHTDPFAIPAIVSIVKPSLTDSYVAMPPAVTWLPTVFAGGTHPANSITAFTPQLVSRFTEEAR